MNSEPKPLPRRNILATGLLVGGGAILTGCAHNLVGADTDTSTATKTFTPKPRPKSTISTTNPPSPKPSHTETSPSSTAQTSSETTTSSSTSETTSTTTPATAETAPPKPSQTSSATTTKSHQPATANLPSNNYIFMGPTNKRNVAISIDDFSNSGSVDYLDGLLKLARKTDTKFTMFPIGQALGNLYNNRRGNQLWQAALDEGHVIGNHTWDHDEQIATRSALKIRQELDGQQQMLNRVLKKSYDEYLFRPPGGSGGFHEPGSSSSYERQFQYQRGVVEKLGYWITMWSTDSNDRNGYMVTPGDGVQAQDKRFLSKIFNGVGSDYSEKVRSGSIILVHPTTLSLDGMGRLISGLHARGFNCVNIPELF